MPVLSPVELTEAEVINLTGDGYSADDLKVLQGISIDLSGPAPPAFMLTEGQIIILHEKGCPTGDIMTCASPERKHELFEKYVYTITDKEQQFLEQRNVDTTVFKNRGIARAAIKLICSREKASGAQIQELNRMKKDYGLGADAHVPEGLTRAGASSLLTSWRSLRPVTKDQLIELTRRGTSGVNMPTTFDDAHELITAKATQRKRKLGNYQMAADKARYISAACGGRAPPSALSDSDDDGTNNLDGTTTPPPQPTLEKTPRRTTKK